jgi:hypothetical protein
MYTVDHCSPPKKPRTPPQDYLYVRGFTTFAGAVLAAAPDTHIEVLLSGIGALTDEINWFRAKAEQRGIQLTNTGTHLPAQLRTLLCAWPMSLDTYEEQCAP